LALVAGLVGDVAGDKNIGRLSLKDQRGVGDGCAAPPEFHGARIAGRSQGSGSKVGADEKRVAVEPGNEVSAFGQGEGFVRDEGFRREVELADHDGITAAAGKAEEIAVVVGIEGNGGAPDPVLFLGAGESIEIENGVPLRVFVAVVFRSRAAPKAAGVGLVLPEVVVERAAFRDGGDAGAGVVDREQAVVERLVAGGGGELGEGYFVLRFDPCERLRALDVLARVLARRLVDSA
jgi:hypothetical protein